MKNVAMISPCFDFNFKSTSITSIKLMVLHWTTGAYVSNQCIPLICMSPRSHNLALNFLMSPSEQRFKLKSHIDLSSPQSKTSQYPIPSRVSSSMNSALKYWFCQRDQSLPGTSWGYLPYYLQRKPSGITEKPIRKSNT